MKTHHIVTMLLCCLCSGAFSAVEHTKKAGSSLHSKESIGIDDLPKEVLAEVKRVRPGMTPKEAEKETKNGRTYYDVEGIDENGAEIELDLTLLEGKWKVVEVQRDLILSEAPKGVQKKFAAVQSDAPAVRVIESDQGQGVIIYEIYTRSATGVEKKFEIKYQNDRYELLGEEWSH